MKKNQTYDELEAMAKRTENNLTNPVMQPVAPANVATPGVDTRQVKAKVYDSIFGESPAVQQARAARNASYQDMLNARKQSAEQQRTDDVKMARWNALGNVLTTMVQPLGWGIGGGFSGGAPGGVQQYDDRQYLNSFNRAVKAADDIRNIGNAEAEYRFKLADEDYRRALALDDEARKRKYSQEDLERKYQQKMDEMQKKFENDMAKVERQGEIRQQIAEFNATHKIRSRSTGQNADWRTQQKLMQGYLDYAKIEHANNRQPKGYLDWVKDSGFDVLAPGGSSSSSSSSSSSEGVDIGL